MARVLTGERLEKELARLEAMKEFEREYDGCSLICGVDEAGRGPLAGPVAAGAVILPKDCTILYLNDSKKLSEKRREELFLEIRGKAVFKHECRFLFWHPGLTKIRDGGKIDGYRGTADIFGKLIRKYPIPYRVYDCFSEIRAPVQDSHGEDHFDRGENHLKNSRKPMRTGEYHTPIITRN